MDPATNYLIYAPFAKLLVAENHLKFFDNKERTQRFYDLKIEDLNEENILFGLMSVICRTRICFIDEAVRVLLMDDTLEDNRFIADFRRRR